MAENRFEQRWKEELAVQQSNGRLRSLPEPQEVEADFSTNDYLGFRNHPQIIEAGVEAARRFGAGSGSSRLIASPDKNIKQLEEKIAAWTGYSRALFFSTGWQMNVSVLQTLAGKGDAIILDRKCHNSIVRGSYASGAEVFRFQHNDLEDAARLLKKASQLKKSNLLLVTESVFSMDGDSPPLQELQILAREYGALFVVDEAHAIGVFGPAGSGLCRELENVSPDVLLGTCGKSIGTQGGFVCGSGTLISYLVNFCNGFMYSTAPSPFLTGATLEAVNLVSAADGERKTLLNHIEAVRSALQIAQHDRSPVIPFHAGSEESLEQLRQKLLQKGITAGFIRPPTVPLNTCRVRLSLSAAHSAGQVQKLIRVLLDH